MKSMTVIILLTVSLLFSISCKKDTSTICENILEQGIADSSSLVGEWELKSFAYTIYGRTIKEKEENDGALLVTDSNQIVLRVVGGNTLSYNYELQNDNHITNTGGGGTLINSPADIAELENDLREALENTFCFVIKDNELLIHYNETDEPYITI